MTGKRGRGRKRIGMLDELIEESSMELNIYLFGTGPNRLLITTSSRNKVVSWQNLSLKRVATTTKQPYQTLPRVLGNFGP